MNYTISFNTTTLKNVVIKNINIYFTIIKALSILRENTCKFQRIQIHHTSLSTQKHMYNSRTVFSNILIRFHIRYQMSIFLEE